jgi:hypothetical protein
VVIPDELSDAADRDENAGVEKRLQLEADRNQLSASDAEKRRRPGVGQDALLGESDDRGFDFGVDAGSLARGGSGGEGRIRTGGRVISPTAV